MFSFYLNLLGAFIARIRVPKERARHWSVVLGATYLTLARSAPAADPQSGSAFGWRGDGSGRFPEATPPIEWNGDSGKNILWSTKVGPSKFSSLAVANDKIFVVAEPARLVCVNATKGAILWEKNNGFEQLPEKVQSKPPLGDQGNTTPTPVTNGRFVYAVFGSGLVGCYDLEGRRRWFRFIDAEPGLDFGRSSSPALHRDKLLVSIHHLFALDADTGKVLWENQAVLERFGTPVAGSLGGVEVALAPSGQIVNLLDGKLMSNASELQYASPIVHDATAYFVGTVSSATIFSEQGREAAGRTIWKTELEGTYFASPVFDRGLIFTASNEGIFRVINAADGRTLLSKELEIASANGHPGAPSANLYPSLTLAGKYLFLSNDAGETLVLEPGREYKEIKRNDLGEGFSGAPVFVGSRMYIRSKDRLYCIGNK